VVQPAAAAPQIENIPAQSADEILNATRQWVAAAMAEDAHQRSVIGGLGLPGTGIFQNNGHTVNDGVGAVTSPTGEVIGARLEKPDRERAIIGPPASRTDQ
jgi:hypothetical protein